MQALLLILVLVPAPRETPPFPVGEWQAEWCGSKWDVTFFPDGTCNSNYGRGFWASDSDGNVWFSEQADTSHYSMSIDQRSGVGVGWFHSRSTGSYHNEVKVKMIRKKR
jgi:hypothetical protein